MPERVSGRGPSLPRDTAPEPQGKAPAGKPKKRTAKPVKKIDKRGTPKGKGTLKGGRGGRIGNPPYVATAEDRIRVEAWVAAGTQHVLVSEFLGIDYATLKRHFAPELANGKERALSKIGGSMIADALNGDKDSQKFVLARVGGWKATIANEQSGPDGGPIVYINEPPRRDLSHLTEDEKIELERLTAKLEAPVERPADQ